ncbi:MAG: DUF4179 domain-containing protein [Oscillospiraceae bacterium]|nr:DUF4179 domain-containing protein [Oscillospiraceae bacterium]
MKNEKIINAWDKINSSEETKQQIYYEIMQKQVQPKKQVITFKPILVMAIVAALFVTTVFAAVPAILKMLGSEIGFFDSDQQKRYSPDQELIKKYSSEVGVTAEGDGYSLTIDNIAFDGTFMNVFYTVKKDVSIVEEIIQHYELYNLNSEPSTHSAVTSNNINLEMPGYTLSFQKYFFVTMDGYYVSDYELKVVQRFIITEDLPDVFDLTIKYKDQSLPLTIDMSKSKIETISVKPNLSFTVTQNKFQRFITEDDDEDSKIIQHNMIVEKVNISPLGNLLLLIEKGGTSPANRELFENYFILDDKGNCYGKLAEILRSRADWQKDETIIVEFYGDVPSDTQYLKLVPYNFNRESDWLRVELNELPIKLNQSQYGSVTIESYIVTENTVTVFYSCEELGRDVDPYLSFEKPTGFGYSQTIPVYNSQTGLYSMLFTFAASIENTEAILSGIYIPQYDIELLEDQAIIIPLK